MNRKFSYTLTEVLVSLAIIGILATVVIPMIMSVIPNRNAIMIKKAYYSVENIVKLLINDSYYYPDMRGNCFDGNNISITENECYLGFDYAENLPLKIKSSDGTITNGSDTKKYKFIYLFLSYLDTVKPFDNYLNNITDDTFGFVETTDGMVFNLRSLKFSVDESGEERGHPIFIDVNGKKGPNSYAPSYKKTAGDNNTKCSTYSEWIPDKSANNYEKKRFDRFAIKIYKDGSIEIPYGQTEVLEIINSNKRDNLK